MDRPRSLGMVRGWVFCVAVGVAGALALAGPHPMGCAQSPASPNPAKVPSSSVAANNQATETTPNGNAAPKKSVIDQAKSDAAELSTLADQLSDELSKINVNVYSLDVLRKTEKIEKLAKKIKGEADAD